MDQGITYVIDFFLGSPRYRTINPWQNTYGNKYVIYKPKKSRIDEFSNEFVKSKWLQNA